jgi:hypothetical protein
VDVEAAGSRERSRAGGLCFSGVILMSASHGYRQTIGELLCAHSSESRVEYADRPSPLDIRQDAALRAVVALRKLGKEADLDAIACFDADPKLVATCYQWAKYDALKRQLGRGAGGRPTATHDGLDTLHDPRQEAILDEIDADAAAEIRRLSEEGIPGLTLDQTHRVLTVMRQVQDLKASERTPLPAALRQTICRLRRETRLPLDTSLL